MHKYLNDIGIKSIDRCIFNTEDIADDRQESFNIQRSEYGFDERETWSLDYTSATWLYSHLMMYKEIASSVVDLTFHKFNIPVLYDMSEEEIEENKEINHTSFPTAYQKEVEENHTEIECIDYMISYLKFYLESDKHLDETFNNKDNDKMLEYDVREHECLRQAFKIYSIVISALWW